MPTLLHSDAQVCFLGTLLENQDKSRPLTSQSDVPDASVYSALTMMFIVWSYCF